MTPDMPGLGAAVGAPDVKTNGQVGRIPEAGYRPPPGGMTGGKPATQEQQAAYQRYVGMAMLVLYDDDFMQRAVKLMKSSGPVRGVAEVTANVVVTTLRSAKKKGVQVPGEVVLHGGAEILALTAEMAEAAGLPPLDKEQARAAIFLATDMARVQMQKLGLINQEAVKSDLEIFRRMDGSGELEPVAAMFGEQS